MAGKPYKVGRFAHTLRMRLMREHVGVDVDSIEEDELMSRPPVADADDIEVWDPDHEQQSDDEAGKSGITRVKRRTARERMMRTFGTGMSGRKCYSPSKIEISSCKSHALLSLR